MELETTAVIGRLNPARVRAESAGASSYNISRLGLTATATTEPSARPAPVRTVSEWPIVVAEPADESAPATCPHGALGSRRKTSFALPTDLLEQVRARAAAAGTYQYAVVAQALQWFFRQQLESLPGLKRKGWLGMRLWHVLEHWVTGRGESKPDRKK